MTGIEFVTLLLALVLGVVLIATAWWVAGVHTLLERLTVGLETRHLERYAERAAEKRTVDARQKHFFQWLAETASTLKGIHRTVEICADRPDTMVMTSPPALQVEPVSDPMPSTVKSTRQADAASSVAEPSGDGPRESDADTLCWKGPPSGHTLLGVGATDLNDTKRGAVSAPLRGGLGKPR
jgi:hypothetical protein